MAQVIHYVVKYETFAVTDAEFDVVVALYGLDQKVTAIKFLRLQYGLGLKEAKDICDAIAVLRVREGNSYDDSI